MRRARELSERLGDLPRDVLRRTDFNLPRSPGAVGTRTAQRRGNFSPAIPIVTADGSRASLPHSQSRAYLIVFNIDATNSLWVNVGVPARANSCIKVPPGGNWEPWVAPVNAIYLVGDVTPQTAILMEGSQW